MNYALDGDLNQMSIQKRYLQNECAGFNIISQSGYWQPFLENKEEYDRAISCFWLDKVEGWWNYKSQLIKNNICTEEEFFEVLSDRVNSI